MSADPGPACQAPQDRRSWTITLPGIPSMVPVARTFIRAFLGSHPYAPDAELIISEYAANAIRYSAAGEGGVIQVTVAAAAGTVRIEVTDAGPPAACDTDGDGNDENGRGLLIVDALAARWGHYGPGDGPLTAWAELGGPAGDGRGRPRSRGGVSRGEMR